MKTNREGLTSDQAAKNFKQFGGNTIDDPDKISAVKIVLRQLKNNFIIYLLAVAAIVSFFVGEEITAYTVIGVIVMVVGMGFFQEYRAEKAIASLKEMITPVSVVIRDGKEQEVETSKIVPDDLLLLRLGEKVPADCQVLSASNFLLNEAMLTGEAKPIMKGVSDLVFAGTYVVEGKCLAKVTVTGMNTKFGQIVKMVSRGEKELPLMDKINKIARVMVVAAVSISVATGGIMLVQAEAITTKTIIHSLIVGIALMVSAFPEGLPVVLVTSLAVGASRMAKNNAIVNRMSIIETLGETTVICADKTGTITMGRMTVEKIISSNPRQLLQAAVLCSDSRGNSTDQALLAAAAAENIHRADLSFEVEEEIPFSSERKIMSIRGVWEGKLQTFSKGAPEVILKKCRLTGVAKKKVLQENHDLTTRGYRTIAVADNNKYLGLVAIADPPRAEVKEALETCRQAGIKVKMITGDHRQTAVAIASQIGLTGEVIDGEELDGISDDQLREKISDYIIFCRVRPEHKLRIVKILKSLGEVVTMTGDGVNDAPALKEAQIGVAMGTGGTDVSRSVADLTLKDNNFATIVLAIKEGRMIFNNMRKFVAYQLSCNYAELMILFFGVLIAPVLGWETPVLLALQILFMNLVTDDFPAITFAFNKPSMDVMQEAPRKRPEIMGTHLMFVSVLAGALMTGLSLLSFYISFNLLGQDIVVARTTALITLILLEIIHAFNFRSFRHLTLTRSPLTNHYLFWASLVSVVCSLLIIYTPLNLAFGTAPVGLYNWLVGMCFAVVFIIIFDLLKLLNRRLHFLNFN
jgi:Ca2+-transporting ATPase